jgi:putative SOS response-associated peptidase YedK
VCGRYVSSSPPDELARYFDVDAVGRDVLEPSWNVAPTDEVFVVVERRGTRLLDTYRWGLVPFWADDPKVGSRFINARSETLATGNAFRHAFARRRCLVPADGFYEWKHLPGTKVRQPYFIHRPDGEPYAFAGLWETWRPKGPDPDPPRLHTCTIITGPPNSTVAGLHDRMPVMLPADAWGPWLDPDQDDLVALGDLLRTAPDDWTVMHPVSTAVNNVRSQGPELALAIELGVGPGGEPPGPVQGTLL